MIGSAIAVVAIVVAIFFQFHRGSSTASADSNRSFAPVRPTVLPASNTPFTRTEPNALLATPEDPLASSDERERVLRDTIDRRGEGTAEAIGRLLQSGESYPASYRMIEALKDLRHPSAVRPLAWALKEDVRLGHRRLAAEALGSYIKHEEAQRALEQAARNDPDEYVRANAIRSLWYGGSPRIETILEDLDRVESHPIAKTLIAHLMEEGRLR